MVISNAHNGICGTNPIISDVITRDAIRKELIIILFVFIKLANSLVTIVFMLELYYVKCFINIIKTECELYFFFLNNEVFFFLNITKFLGLVIDSIEYFIP